MDNCGYSAVTNIDVDSAGNMYGWLDPCSDDLVSIDKSTGIATIVGNSGVGTGRYGLAFDEQDILWLVQGTWREINTATGTVVSSKSPGGGYGHHGTFDWATGLYYDVNGSRGIDVSDPVSGLITSFPQISGLHTLAFMRTPFPLVIGPASGNEDTNIPLSIAANNSFDGYLVSDITISGVPAGASLSAGTDMGGGVWVLTEAELVGLYLIPPVNSNVDIHLTVSVDAHNNQADADNTYTTSLLVDLIGVADDPTVSTQVTPPYGWQQRVPVNIQVQLGDTDGSESLSYVRISNVPTDAFLTNGVNLGGGVWLLQPSDLAGLQIDVPTRLMYYVSWPLTVTVEVAENDGATNVTQQSTYVLYLGNRDSGDSPPATTVISTSGGGCTLGSGEAGDLLLPLLLVGALVVLVRRRTAR